MLEWYFYVPNLTFESQARLNLYMIHKVRGHQQSSAGVENTLIQNVFLWDFLLVNPCDGYSTVLQLDPLEILLDISKELVEVQLQGVDF